MLVQEASSLDPADNRQRLDAVVPTGADLVVLPEAWQRYFGEPGSDLTPYAEPLDGPFVTQLLDASRALRGGAGARSPCESQDRRRTEHTERLFRSAAAYLAWSSRMATAWIDCFSRATGVRNALAPVTTAGSLEIDR